jgi:hypothetical protein
MNIHRYRPVSSLVGINISFLSRTPNIAWSSSALDFVPPRRAYPGKKNTSLQSKNKRTKLSHTWMIGEMYSVNHLVMVSVSSQLSARTLKESSHRRHNQGTEGGKRQLFRLHIRIRRGTEYSTLARRWMPWLQAHMHFYSSGRFHIRKTWSHRNNQMEIAEPSKFDRCKQWATYS